MSTIRVDNFAPSAGGTEFGIGGIAKAWVNANSAAGINFDVNISSSSDLGTGNYSFAFTNPLTDQTNASLQAQAVRVAGSARSVNGAMTSTSAFELVCFLTSDGVTAADLSTQSSLDGGLA